MSSKAVSGALLSAMIVSAALSGRAATVVERGDFDHLVGLAVSNLQPGGVSGTVTNRSELEITDVVVLVRHAWVWDYRRDEIPDTAARADYVTVAGPLAPGGTAAFASRAARPDGVPENARYVGRARVVEVTELHPLDIE